MKSIFSFIVCVLLTQTAFTQSELRIPGNIISAFEKGTRSYDGKPGTNYWINKSDYKITAEIDPYNKLITGSEEITYYNNSPDTLKQLVIRLYHNITKPTARRDFLLNKNALTEGMLLKELLVNNTKIDVNDRNLVNETSTNLIINLEQKIGPGSKVSLNISWEDKIPPVPSVRYGSYDSTTMFIAYWYPQISVYDDIDGWDMLDYMGTLEMYNDFNNYDVTLTVPIGFQIWATGVWQNPDEILNEKYLSLYEKAWSSDEVIRIIRQEDLDNKDIYKSDAKSSFRFVAENVPDFAFATSDHYLWDATSFVVDSKTGRRVLCAAAYKESSKDFVDNAYYAKETLKYFSFEIPGIPFPYPCATVFNGAGGMEFPMIVNNGSTTSKAGTVGLTSHELAHQYMPFFMGTNERKYPFMDEGWAVMLPYDFQEKMSDGNLPRLNTIKGYEEFAGNEFELPLTTPSPVINWRSYRMAAYNKPAIAYDNLRKLLGDELFLKALREYMHRWNGKHPIPTDFFLTFNDVTKMDLNWYWKPWFYDFSFPDLAIEKATIKNKKLNVFIGNKGKLPLPIKLQVMLNDVVIKEVTYKADIWKKDLNSVKLTIDGIRDYDAIIIGDKSIPDINKINNVYFK
ncbi:MAG: hypothetical protein B6D44_10570 [Ignavibacteriales bacterium UTCHB2]|nr:MAG: hypothetical protein BWY38_02496 [Ignavibacteria bacterium ADurb.Bin266]OQY72183.1 MAG: hypothetical protein B6D44_10570 [Ignavibacteriales bacterium UTCHB2]HQI41743.1 M1 family metallopeptidase [Ignavibacteriaceae bacterium]